MKKLIILSSTVLVFACSKKDINLDTNESNNNYNNSTSIESKQIGGVGGGTLYVCYCCHLTQINGEWSCPEPYIDCGKITPVPCYLAKSSEMFDEYSENVLISTIKELDQAINMNNVHLFFQSKKKRETLFRELERDNNTIIGLINGSIKVRKFNGSTDIIYTIYNPETLKTIYSISVPKKIIE